MRPTSLAALIAVGFILSCVHHADGADLSIVSQAASDTSRDRAEIVRPAGRKLLNFWWPWYIPATKPIADSAPTPRVPPSADVPTVRAAPALADDDDSVTDETDFGVFPSRSQVTAGPEPATRPVSNPTAGGQQTSNEETGGDKVQDDGTGPSFDPCNYAYNTIYNGTVLSVITVDSAGVCCWACRRDELCNAWVFCGRETGCDDGTEEGEVFPRGRCELKLQELLLRPPEVWARGSNVEWTSGFATLSNKIPSP